MDYLVPAWHGLPTASAVTTPQLHFDDALTNLHLLKNVHRVAGLLVTDYQPHLMTKLSTAGLTPRRIYSVFDLLQGVTHYNSKAFTYEDLNWPADAYLEFSAFHLNVFENGHMYAMVIFDENSRIIYVDRYAADQIRRWLIFDSRGFLSSICFFNVHNQETERIYYDEAGNWCFKHTLSTDAVDINPTNNYLGLPLHYDHLTDLLTAVVRQEFFANLHSRDRLLVSLDDEAVVDQRMYLDYPTVFYVSSWNPVTTTYNRLHNEAGFHCIFDTADLAHRLQTTTPLVISPFQTYFKLGHSQRQDRQRIVLFVEDTDINTLAQLGEEVFQRLMKAKGDDELYLLSYTRQGFDASQQVIQFLQTNHASEFQLIDPDDDDAKQELVDEDEKVQLVIKAQQCTSNNDVLAMLDKTRLLIDWGQKPDNYLRTTCVSVGIPRLQQVVTPEVVDHQNGLVIENIQELPDALDYFLASLKNWNQALTYDVKVLNAHSGEQIIGQWDQAWNQFLGGGNTNDRPATR